MTAHTISNWVWLIGMVIAWPIMIRLAHAHLEGPEGEGSKLGPVGSAFVGSFGAIFWPIVAGVYLMVVLLWAVGRYIGGVRG